MSYQVLARKWRPKNFSEMVGQEHVLRALINALDTDRVHHAFLFTGTRGVGKTTIARILAKSLNCETGVSSTPCGTCAACREIDEGRFVDLIEVDAASRTKVEDTRDLLDNVQYAPTRGRYKVYLIDEVHMLSNHSFNALLKTLEEPPPHVKFLLATTDPQKLPVTILSRCLQFNLRRLSPELIRDYLQHLLSEEQMAADAGVLALLARAADGSMRDALSLLDQAIAFSGGQLGDADVRAMLGTIEQTYIYGLLQALLEGSGEKLLQQVQQLAGQAPDYSDVLAELLTCLHHVALLQQVPEAYDEAMGDESQLQQFTQQFSAEDIQLYYQIGLVGRRDLNLAPDPRNGLEMVLLRMLAFRPDATVVSNEQQANKAHAQKGIPPSHRSADSAVSMPQETVAVNEAPAAMMGQAAVVKKTESETIQATIDDDWFSIVNQLELVGVLKQLAMHCVIKQRQHDLLVLALDPANEYLYTKERQERLQELIASFSTPAMRLNIEIEQTAQETPAARVAREQQERQTEAETAIQNDATVQKIIETFDAKVDVNSIQPLG